MIEERLRFEVLMENVETSLKVLAEAHVAQVDHLHRIDGRLERLETKVDRLDVRVGVLETKFDRLDVRIGVLETKFDRLETRFDKLETRFDKLETRFDKFETRFEVFASDTQQRLGRIETHLHMAGAHPRRSPQKPTSGTSAKRSKKH